MTTFLTTAQREFLIEEYKEQLVEFDQLEEYGHLLEWIATLDNVTFFKEICDWMPIYAEPAGRRILAKVKANKEVKMSDYFS